MAFPSTSVLSDQDMIAVRSIQFLIVGQGMKHVLQFFRVSPLALNAFDIPLEMRSSPGAIH